MACDNTPRRVTGLGSTAFSANLCTLNLIIIISVLNQRFDQLSHALKILLNVGRIQDLCWFEQGPNILIPRQWSSDLNTGSANRKGDCSSLCSGTSARNSPSL